MRSRQEIETDFAFGTTVTAEHGAMQVMEDPFCIPKVVLEVLLDIRDQNAALLAVYQSQVENERDALLATAGVQGAGS